MLTVKSISLDKINNAEVKAWEAFQQQADYQNPFYSLSFARAVAASGKNVQVSILYEGDSIIGFFPHHKKMSKIRSFLGEVERLGGAMSDYFGFLLKPDQVVSPGEVLSSAGLTRIVFSHLPESLFPRGMSGEESRVGTRIILERDGTRYWRELRQKDSKFTSDTERRERACVKAYGPLTFSFNRADRIEFETLIERKRQQYKRTGVKDALAEQWQRNLLMHLHTTNKEDCSGILSTLHAGETWVASHFGLFARGTLHYWFPVYNPELQKFSPGRLLLKQFIMRAAELDISVIDRGEGDSPAKRDFANYEHRLYRGEWHNGSVRASFCKIVERCAWKLGALVR